MEPTESGAGFMSLWIIEKESGIPISCVNLSSTQIDSVLFGGFMVAIRGLMDDFEIGQLTSFSTDLANLLFTGSEDLISVIAIKKEFPVDFWYPTLLRIHQKAETFYQSKKQVILDTSLFKELEPEFRSEILVNITKYREEPISDKNLLNEKSKQSKEAKKAKQKMEDSGLW